MLSQRHTLILKALAIFGVLTIHLLSTLPINKADPSLWGISSVILDQLARFSVPLFIALSGYGLAIKYVPRSPKPVPFFKSRLIKLLPLYLFWSVLLFFLLRAFTFLGSSQGKYSFAESLLFGKADYQLYFIPMILQLYILFPILSYLLNKSGPVKLLLGGFLLQAIAFIVYTRILVTDQWQYTFFFPWIGYFTLGMSLSRLPLHRYSLHRLQPYIIGGFIISAFIVATQSLHNISHGLNPLDATRFTRFPVMIYASITMVILFLIVPRSDKLPRQVQMPLLWIGKYSYLIFLSHTLILRLLLLLSTHAAPIPELIVISGVGIVALITSPKLTSMTV